MSFTSLIPMPREMPPSGIRQPNWKLLVPWCAITRMKSLHTILARMLWRGKCSGVMHLHALLSSRDTRFRKRISSGLYYGNDDAYKETVITAKTNDWETALTVAKDPQKRTMGIAISLVTLFSPVVASEQDDSRAIETVLSHSLSGDIWAPTPAADLPPGLSRGMEVQVEQLPGMAGKAFYYMSTQPRNKACGIALYGPVSNALKDELVKLINSRRPTEFSQATAFYHLPGAAPAEETYWGVSGIEGVLVSSREPSANAPTLEIDFHQLLVV
jgi:hypothetical protein